MALSPNALVSVAKVREVLAPQSVDDSYLEFFINAASESANKISRRTLAFTDYVKILDGPGSDELMLPDFPVSALSRLSEDAGRVWGAETDISIDDLILEGDSGIVFYKLGVFSQGKKTIRCEYSAGYEIDAAPEDLIEAVIETVSFYMNRIGANGSRIGIKSLQASGAVTTSYETSLPLTVRRVFESYSKEPSV